jgi:aryl-alcohol dehydrogenase-like predicted oxidoreductase
LSILSAEHDIPRTSIYVQTKFTSLDGQDLSKPIPYDAQAEVETQVDQSIQKSLSQLGVEWIDCLVMHSPLRTKEVSFPVDGSSFLSPKLDLLHHSKLFEHTASWNTITLSGFSNH